MHGIFCNPWKYTSLTRAPIALDFNAGIGFAVMLGQSNYLALVGGGKQPKFPQNKVCRWLHAPRMALGFVLTASLCS